MTEQSLEVKDQSQESNPQYYSKTTLGKLGPILPIVRKDRQGTFIDDLSFSFKEWDFETEEKLGKMQNDADSPGHFAFDMMLEMLETFCGQNFSEMKKEDKELILGNIEFGNLIYMYVYLRYDELSNEVKLDFNCPQPRCQKPIENWVANLDDLEVRQKTKDHKREIIYTLKKPITVNDKLITGLKFNVSKWATMLSTKEQDAKNQGAFKRRWMESAFSGVIVENQENPDKPVLLSADDVIRKLKKYDIEKASDEIVQNDSGPIMGMSGKCPHCDQDFFKDLTWNFDSFFGSSSL